MSRSYCRLMVTLLCLLNTFVLADEKSTDLFRESAALSTALEVSHDYQYGFLIEADPVKSLAWMKVYVDMLPKSYPRKAELLDPLANQLDGAEKQRAMSLANHYQSKYRLVRNMTESHLSLLFGLRSKVNIGSQDDADSLADLDHFFQAISAFDQSYWLAFKAFYRQYAANKPKTVLVFGQVVLDSEGIPEQVEFNQHCLVAPTGYFMCFSSHPLAMAMNGFSTREFPINTHETVQSLGRVVLHKLPANASASIVGRFDGLENEDALSVKLYSSDALGKQTDELWMTKPLTLTILGNGQFYTNHLSLGEYQLFISYQGHQQMQRIKLMRAGVKVLPDIRLKYTPRQ